MKKIKPLNFYLERYKYTVVAINAINIGTIEAKVVLYRCLESFYYNSMMEDWETISMHNT